MLTRSPDAATIRAAELSDAEAVAAVYNHYVVHSIATYEEEPVSAEEMAGRMAEVREASLPWVVADDDGRVVGYAYATKWRTRMGYRFSVEISVYLAPGAEGRGLGSRLYRELFPLLEARGIHTVIGGIALPNDPSVALHEKFGMQKVAHFHEVGFKFGKWIDTAYWQRTLTPGA